MVLGNYVYTVCSVLLGHLSTKALLVLLCTTISLKRDTEEYNVLVLQLVSNSCSLSFIVCAVLSCIFKYVAYLKMVLLITS